MPKNQIPEGSKTLAQVLFETSPNVGWEGPWRRLSEDQRRWWEHFAEVARAHVLSELRGDGKEIREPGLPDQEDAADR